MKLGFFQYATRWMDAKSNLDLVEEVCKSNKDSIDLMILPEMFSTGFTMNPKAIPIFEQDETIRRLQHISSTYEMCIGGSLPMFRNGHWYNTFVIVNANGIIHHYDKIKLFTLTGEDRKYAAGQQNAIVQFQNWNLQTLICYDLRFPNLSFTNEVPDLLIYSANWPITRIHHWQSLLMARAIENQCFVLGVNRIGTDKNSLTYNGQSTLIDFSGKVIVHLGDGEKCGVADIIKEEMETYRKQFPFYRDRNL